MKKRRILAVLLIVVLAVASFSGCGKKKEKEEPKKETKQVVQEEEEPEEVEEEPEVNQETFAIFGVDSRENNLGKGTRSDSLMVVNIDNTKIAPAKLQVRYFCQYYESYAAPGRNNI